MKKSNFLYLLCLLSSFSFGAEEWVNFPSEECSMVGGQETGENVTQIAQPDYVKIPRSQAIFSTSKLANEGIVSLDADQLSFYLGRASFNVDETKNLYLVRALFGNGSGDLVVQKCNNDLIVDYTSQSFGQDTAPVRGAIVVNLDFEPENIYVMFSTNYASAQR